MPVLAADPSEIVPEEDAVIAIDPLAVNIWVFQEFEPSCNAELLKSIEYAPAVAENDPFTNSESAPAAHFATAPTFVPASGAWKYVPYRVETVTPVFVAA